MTTRRGVVAAGHAATAEAAVQVLREGGNAVDAAIAAVCTSFAAEPVLTAAGGGGFMLVRDPSGRAMLYDGFTMMPSGRSEHAELVPVPIDFGDTVQTFHVGQASVGTPSLIAMLFRAHRDHGRMPMREALAPALAALREGVQLNALQASFIRLLKPILTRTEACRALHAPEGELLEEGQPFVNRDLANTLEMLAIDGVDEMYRGDLARAIVRACRPHGLLTMDDLAREQVELRAPLMVPAFGGTLLTNPPPSSGGLLIAFAAEVLSRLAAAGLASEFPWPVLISETLAEASRLRTAGFDARIHAPGIRDEVLAHPGIEAAVSRVRERLVNLAPEARKPEPANRHGSTTHVSIVDGQGMAVSMTTSNGEGSGIVVEGSGIHLNNMLGEEDINPLGFHALPAGTRLSSMMAPSMFVRDGMLRLVIGSGGSNRLRGAILQVLARTMLMDQPIEEAVAAPRLHNEGDELDLEPGLIDERMRALWTRLGWRLREWRAPSVYFGGVHAILIDPSGRAEGAGDPRRGGAVAWT